MNLICCKRFFVVTLLSFELICQTRTAWSLEQVAIRSPSKLTRTIRTHSRCPVNVLTQYLKKLNFKFSKNNLLEKIAKDLPSCNLPHLNCFVT